jgi:type I restriction enzyme S subunit
MPSNSRRTAYGNIAADFVVDHLASLCTPHNGIQTGPFGSQLHQADYLPVGTPIITVEHLGDNRIIHQDIPCVSDEDKERLSKYILRKGDIVFSRVGSVDRRALVREEDGWLFSGRCLRIRPDPSKIDPHYLSYFFGLPSFQNHIRAISVGATMPSLNTEILSNIIVCYPGNLSEQRAIAHILGTLDDKIELNRQMNQTLEALAQAIFKSWFVDFEPVRAKMEGRWRRGELLPGLPARLWDMFPDQLVDSEMGDIPKGWKVGRLGEVLVQRVERCAASEETSAVPYVPIDCISSNSLFLEKSKPGTEAKSSLTKFYKEDLIFGAMRPYFHKICIAPFDGTTRTTAFVLYPKCTEGFAFATLMLSDQKSIDYATGHSTGSTIPYASWVGSLEDMPIVVPPSNARTALNLFAYPLLKSIPERYHENSCLTSLRDTLLPKLISGEIRIKDAEKFVEAAT